MYFYETENLPGVAATRFSSGNVSLGTPIIRSAVFTPRGFASVAKLAPDLKYLLERPRVCLSANIFWE